MGASKDNNSHDQFQCEEGPGVCAFAMTIFSLFLIIVTLPLSLFFVVKVVQVWNTSMQSKFESTSI